ncbi:hypothetical protein FJV83_31460 [Mesorhizobium sp. WSM4307]|uniref:hypothetical protein n=1 Tax=unclassified Mesorhizobium TaxID=325217 RepID=UPI00115C64A3|nr:MULTISPECIES: hypothetical protein [unclassified Mesorhizobium]TRC72044.1 hypothetical protein FJV81_30420 [Mesorhizobium sp. WSM4315]TRC77820.1 hypothetical protein FJV83_31460 [Mesorhizobium sp. WSM4307]
MFDTTIVQDDFSITSGVTYSFSDLFHYVLTDDPKAYDSGIGFITYAPNYSLNGVPYDVGGGRIDYYYNIFGIPNPPNTNYTDWGVGTVTALATSGSITLSGYVFTGHGTDTFPGGYHNNIAFTMTFNIDADATVTSVSVGDVEVVEGNTVQIPITIDNALTDGSLTISLAELNPASDALKYMTASQGTSDVGSPTVASVTFTPTSGTTLYLSVPTSNDGFIEPTEKFSVKISAPSQTTTGGSVVIADDIGIVTITNNDVGSNAPIVQVTSWGGIDSDLQPLLLADLTAASGRIAQFFHLPNIEIAVGTATLLGTNLAETRPLWAEVVTADKQHQHINVPGLLYEHWTGSDLNGAGPDLRITLDPSKVGTWYSGHSNVDVTSLLTHELLHGLGFGIGQDGNPPGSLDFPSVWDLHVDQKQPKKGGDWYFDNKYLLTGNGDGTGAAFHLAKSDDLMAKFDNGRANIALSTADIAILNALGYSGAPPKWFVGSTVASNAIDDGSVAALASSDSFIFPSPVGNHHSHTLEHEDYVFHREMQGAVDHLPVSNPTFENFLDSADTFSLNHFMSGDHSASGWWL